MLTKLNWLNRANSNKWLSEHRGKHQLSFPKCGASITPIEDMEDVVDDSFDLDNDTTLDGAQAYEDTLTAIVQPDEQITCENLLASRPFNLKYNDYHVLTSVSRT